MSHGNDVRFCSFGCCSDLASFCASSSVKPLPGLGGGTDAHFDEFQANLQLILGGFFYMYKLLLMKTNLNRNHPCQCLDKVKNVEVLREVKSEECRSIKRSEITTEDQRSTERVSNCFIPLYGIDASFFGYSFQYVSFLSTFPRFKDPIQRIVCHFQ